MMSCIVPKEHNSGEGAGVCGGPRKMFYSHAPETPFLVYPIALQVTVFG